MVHASGKFSAPHYKDTLFHLYVYRNRYLVIFQHIHLGPKKQENNDFRMSKFLRVFGQTSVSGFTYAIFFTAQRTFADNMHTYSQSPWQVSPTQFFRWNGNLYLEQCACLSDSNPNLSCRHSTSLSCANFPLILLYEIKSMSHDFCLSPRVM